MAVTRVIGANGSPVEAPGAQELEGMMRQIEQRFQNLKVKPAMLQGFSKDVQAVLTADSQQAIRDAAGIGAEKVAIKGDPGESPVLAVQNGELQYRLSGDDEWTSLFDLESLRPAPAKDGEPGEDGEDGSDGTSIESVDVYYHLSDSGDVPPESNWRSEPLSAVKGKWLWVRVVIRISDGTERVANLVAYSGKDGQDGQSIKGDPGISIEGPPGTKGDSPQIQVSNNTLQWKLSQQPQWQDLIDITTLKGKPGDNGREVTFKIGDGYIQWQYAGDSAWQNLVSISSLKGDSGENGGNGKQVQLQVAGGQVQWKYDTDSAWKNLIALSSLTGSPGINATTTASATTTTAGLMSAEDKAKLDGVSAPTIKAVASGARVIGTAFTLSATRNSRVTYTVAYSLTALLTVGQNVMISATVDGVEVARVTDAILLGLAGTINRSEVMSFDVPAGKQVLFTKTGTAGVNVIIACGQETLI